MDEKVKIDDTVIRFTNVVYDKNGDMNIFYEYYDTNEYCGAELVGIIDVLGWHELYKSGQKKTCQYIVRLDK